MKKILPIIFLLIANTVLSQTVSMRIVQTNFNAVDPDGAGPATGSVTIQFELMTSAGTVLGDGMGLSFVYQSAMLMPTPTNTTTAQGPLLTSSGWAQGVDNRIGTTVSITYGSQTFDRRMIITFQQNEGVPNAPITNTWTPVGQVTYWTLGNAKPEGGYATPEPGAIIPQNSLSSDGGLTSYDFLSPGLNTPLALGLSVAPVTFSGFEAKCTNNGALVSWSTASEINADYFALERSINGNEWTQAGKVKASGTTSEARHYQLTDGLPGNVFYRIKQVDLDGHATYTSIIRTNCEVYNTGMVIYPVPARNMLNVVISSDKSLKTKLMILDGVGRVVRGMEVQLFKGNNQFQFDLKGLSSGEYILRSSDPGIEWNKKFSIAR